jgi:hypothetical protein
MPRRVIEGLGGTSMKRIKFIISAVVCTVLKYCKARRIRWADALESEE